MIVVLSIVFALAIGWLAGGDIRRLAQIKLRGETVLLASLVVMTAATRFAAQWADGPGGRILWVWAAAAALAVGISLLNRRIVGMPLVALGISLNVLVIALNGYMPVPVDTLAAMDADDVHTVALAESTGFYRLAGEETTLVLLSDALPVPGPDWIRSAVSLGDVIMLLGIVVVIVAAMSGHAERRRGRHSRRYHVVGHQ